MNAVMAFEAPRPLTGDDSAGWRAFGDLYRSAFPEWEREPLDQTARRLESGRYRASGCWAGARLLGFHVCDDVAEPEYSVLTFVAVAAIHRGRGIGRRRIADVVAAHAGAWPRRTLFVGAEAGPARLYAQAGFRRLALDYRVPHYSDGFATQPMTLLARTPGADTCMDGGYVSAVIEHQFIDGYRVDACDERLLAQLVRVPDCVGLEELVWCSAHRHS